MLQPAKVATLRIETPRAFLPLLSPARYKGAYGGRGSGKSHFFADMLIEECVADPTTRAVCIREIQKSLSQSVKQLLEDKIKARSAEGHFEVLDTEIFVLDPAGNRTGIISFQGMQNHTAESIKSLEGYRIAWVEEAQSLSQRSLDLLTPTLRVAGAQIWFSWNPKKKTDPVDAFLRSPDSANDDDITVVEVNFEDNPWFGETSLRRDMERDRRRDPDKYTHIWRGKYESKSEARVFRNWRVESFDTPDDARFYFGADWGFSIDPTVLVRTFIRGSTLYVDREVHEIGCEIDATPFLFGGCSDERLKSINKEAWASLPVKAKLAWRGIPGARKWPVTADSARPETISYMQRHGFPRIQPAAKGKGSLEDGIEFLKAYDIIVHPRCTHCIDELSFYSWETDKLTNEILPKLQDKKNHVIDAMRYAVENLRRSSYTLDHV
jgi:phage terminase large subunit